MAEFLGPGNSPESFCPKVEDRKLPGSLEIKITDLTINIASWVVIGKVKNVIQLYQKAVAQLSYNSVIYGTDNEITVRVADLIGLKKLADEPDCNKMIIMLKINDQEFVAIYNGQDKVARGLTTSWSGFWVTLRMKERKQIQPLIQHALNLKTPSNIPDLNIKLD